MSVYVVHHLNVPGLEIFRPLNQAVNQSMSLERKRLKCFFVFAPQTSRHSMLFFQAALNKQLVRCGVLHQPRAPCGSRVVDFISSAHQGLCCFLALLGSAFWFISPPFRTASIKKVINVNNNNNVQDKILWDFKNPGRFLQNETQPDRTQVMGIDVAIPGNR